jgi:hypothetical protein
MENTVNAFAEHLKRGLVKKENAFGSSAKGIYHQFAIVIFSQEHGSSLRIGDAQPAQQAQIYQCLGLRFSLFCRG